MDIKTKIKLEEKNLQHYIDLGVYDSEDIAGLRNRETFVNKLAFTLLKSINLQTKLSKNASFMLLWMMILKSLDSMLTSILYHLSI